MIEFFSLTVVSIATVLVIVSYVLGYKGNPSRLKTRDLIFLILLEIICMVVGKFGANINFEWWIYYSLPMLLTLFGPTIYFRMNKMQISKYLILTYVSAPLIHVLFSFFFGWKNYMPFIKIPSIWEI